MFMTKTPNQPEKPDKGVYLQKNAATLHTLDAEKKYAGGIAINTSRI